MLDPDSFDQMGQEIVGTLAERFRPRGLMLGDFPRLTNEGHKRRMDAVLAGRGKGPVNLISAIKSLVRQRHPGFTYCGSFGDNHNFEKKLAPELKIVLTFERIHHFGLGKAFTVHLGCECALGAESLRWKHSLFSFFERELLEWTYGQREELEACLEEAAVLLDIALPEYGAAWLSLYRNDHDDILHTMPHRGSLSFCESADIAYGALSPLLPQFRRVDGAWFGRENSPYSYFGLRPRTDSDAASGRLTSGHSWRVRFADTDTNRTATVCVPYRGRIEFVLSNAMRLNRNNVHQVMRAEPSPHETFMLPSSEPLRSGRAPDKPMWQDFVDSPDVMQIAANSGGNEFLSQYPNCSILLGLDAEVSDPPLHGERWQVHYFYSEREKNSRANLGLTISARDRSVVHRHTS